VIIRIDTRQNSDPRKILAQKNNVNLNTISDSRRADFESLHMRRDTHVPLDETSGGLHEQEQQPSFLRL
jgi:hypothetical protein